MIRVLHIVPSSLYGGAQRSVAQLSAAQRLLGVNASVVGLYYNECVEKDLQLRGVPNYFTGIHANYNLRGWVRLYQYIKKLKARMNIYLVNAVKI